MRMLFKRLVRRINSMWVIGIANWASRGGIERVQRTGHVLGSLHYYLAWPFNAKLRRDIGSALELTKREARAVLKQSWILNDQAAFQILCQGSPAFDPAPLIDSVTIQGTEKLRPYRDNKQGAILLSMHMGNTLLAASNLIQQGYGIRAVFREPHRLPKGYLEQCMDRVGLRPMGMDRADPSKIAIEMLNTIQMGEMVFVLMDQGSKKQGLPVTFLNKQVLMPSGIVRIAEKTGVPVFPVNTIAVQPDMHFEVGEPILMGPDRDENIRMLSRQMEQHIIRYPHLWAWHHRRWKRYDLLQDTETESTGPS